MRKSMVVLAGEGETLRGGISHVVFESTEELSLSQFRRGPDCHALLSLDATGRQLLLTPSSGLSLFIR